MAPAAASAIRFLPLYPTSTIIKRKWKTLIFFAVIRAHYILFYSLVQVLMQPFTAPMIRVSSGFHDSFALSVSGVL